MILRPPFCDLKWYLDDFDVNWIGGSYRHHQGFNFSSLERITLHVERSATAALLRWEDVMFIGSCYEYNSRLIILEPVHSIRIMIVKFIV